MRVSEKQLPVMSRITGIELSETPPEQFQRLTAPP
jgi:hypothetical protein